MATYYIVKRNMLLYFKDKTAVFFSLLSVMIVLLLMVVFLGESNQEVLLNLLVEIKGVENTAVDIENVSRVILMWTISGILSVSCLTVPLTVIGLYVEDKHHHRLESLYCTPVSRLKLLGGYLIAAIITGMIMCGVTLGVAYLYTLYKGFVFLDFGEWITIIGLLLLNVTTSSCIILCMSQFIHTTNAWGALSTLMGTLIGFLGGVYLPLGELSNNIQSFLKSLPFLHQASILRGVFTKDAVNQLFSGLPNRVVDEYNQAMGIAVEMFGQTVPIIMQILLLFGCAIVMLWISVYFLKKFKF